MKKQLVIVEDRKYYYIKKKNDVYANCYDITVYTPHAEFHFHYYADKKLISFEYYMDKIRKIINNLPDIPIKYDYYSENVKNDNIRYEINIIKGIDAGKEEHVEICLIYFYVLFAFYTKILFIDYYNKDNFRGLIIDTFYFFKDLKKIKEHISKNGFQIWFEKIKNKIFKRK
jgi:hypothetical protein